MKKNKFRLIMLFVTFLVFTLMVACQDDNQSGAQQESNDNQNLNQEIDFPSETITIIASRGPGSVADAFSRAFARIAEKYVDEDIIIENYEGGNSTVATNHMLSLPADGHTIMHNSNTMALSIGAGAAEIDPENILPLANVGYDYSVLTVQDDSPFETFEDLVDYAKENPGELNWGGAGVNGAVHYFSLRAIDAAGIEANYIPTDDGPSTVQILLGGNVDVIASSIGVVRGQVESGDFRVLASTLPERDSDFPDVHTFEELGYDDLTGIGVSKHFFASADLPDDIVAEWENIIQQTIEDPEWKEYVKQENLVELYQTSEEYSSDFFDLVEESSEIFDEN